jgi:hypothetical protein
MKGSHSKRPWLHSEVAREIVNLPPWVSLRIRRRSSDTGRQRRCQGFLKAASEENAQEEVLVIHRRADESFGLGTDSRVQGIR